jgi:hypothetical protein
MKFSRTFFFYSLLAVVVLTSLMFNGCAPMSEGPTQPLLPRLSAEEMFSDRFELEEEPQFFYDLFGRELLEGHEVHHYKEEKQFDAAGNLVVGRSGQLDSVRFTSQLDRTILAEDTYGTGGCLRSTRFVIGDQLTIKDNTLWPMAYILRKTEFDGFRWDLACPADKMLLSFLNSRISNPVYGAEVAAAGSLAPTIGRRNADEFIENKRLAGFRGQAKIGDILRFGFTYVNLHKKHPQRIENPWTGTVANTPPEQIVLTFRDNSPEDYLSDDPNGAKVAWVEFKIQTYEPATEDTPAIKGELVKVRKEYDEFVPTTIPEADPYSKGGETDDTGNYLTANGFDSFQCVLNMEDEGIDPRTVESVKIDMKVKGDYWIEVLGYSSKNMGAVEDAWPRTETGVIEQSRRYIEMPFRDYIEAPGNDVEDQNKSKIITYEYGAARAAVLWGVDLEGTLPFVGYIQAQYAENPKYKQYPTVSQESIGYSQLAADNPDDPTARTFSEIDGHRFTADEVESGDEAALSRDKAWFVNLKQRRGKFVFEESVFSIDPGWTTTYPGWGANTDRDETYKIPRTSEGQDQSPWDDEDYTLVEDDDDDDDFPDDDDFDGVLPRADDRDLNGILDYQEDFLIFEADPPIFEQTDDLNNNRVLDNLEDDYDPDYKYGADVKGYHISAEYEVLANLTTKLGWLSQSEISSARQADTKYLQVTYERDIPEFGTLMFQNRLVRVKDNIIDYAITLRVGDVDPSEVRDELDFFDAMYNTATLQVMYTGVDNLNLIGKYLLSFEKHYEPAAEDKIRKDKPETEDVDEAIDFMLMDEQLRERRDRREFPFNGMDPVLAFDQANWIPRRYKETTVKFNTFILKASYKIPIGNMISGGFKSLTGMVGGDDGQGCVSSVLSPISDWLECCVFGDMTLTPMFKWIYEKNWDRSWYLKEDGEQVLDKNGNPIPVLDPTKVSPTDYESEEYLRFNQNTRETVGLVRLDYVFTPSLNILGGFQYRKLTNRDKGFKEDFLKPWGEDVRTPIRWRSDSKTRILAIQAINQGEWLGFNIRILMGFQRTEFLPTLLPSGESSPKSTSTETYVRAMMGF